MRVFMTGASGWIGSAVVPELLGHGHEVVGLARSEESATALSAAGAEVHRGSLDDPATLRSGAEACDGVIHLGYNHDFTQMGVAAQTDRHAVQAIGDVLADSDRPFVVASGVLGLTPGRVATELDEPDASVHPRIANVQWVLSLAERGVRATSVRFAPTVHGDGDHGFIATLVAIAQARETSAFIDDGANRWPAVHRRDAARLVRLTLERAPAGSSVHAVAEPGIATRTIAETIAAGLNVPVVSVSSEDAEHHFGWIARFFGADATASNTITRQLLEWEPTQPGLLEDLAESYYYR
jgi:nucleoside-diphosphate-sugar epimerase